MLHLAHLQESFCSFYAFTFFLQRAVLERGTTDSRRSTTLRFCADLCSTPVHEQVYMLSQKPNVSSAHNAWRSKVTRQLILVSTSSTHAARCVFLLICGFFVYNISGGSEFLTSTQRVWIILPTLMFILRINSTVSDINRHFSCEIVHFVSLCLMELNVLKFDWILLKVYFI